MSFDVATPACTARPDAIPGRRPRPALLRRRSGRRSLSTTTGRPRLFRRRSALLRTAVRILRSRTYRGPAMPAASSRHRPGGASPRRSSGPCGSGIRADAHTSIRRRAGAAPPVTCSRSTTSGRGRGEEAPSSTISDCSVMPIISIATQGNICRERGRPDPPCHSGAQNGRPHSKRHPHHRIDSQDFLVMPFAGCQAAQGVSNERRQGAYPQAGHCRGAFEPIADDWRWLDAIASRLSSDFLVEGRNQPQLEPRPELGRAFG